MTGCSLFGSTPDPVPSVSESSVETPAADEGYDPNDLATAIADLPNPEALAVITQVLNGYWIAEDNFFVAFTNDQTSGDHGFDFGYFETEFCDQGTIIASHATGQYTADLTVFFPAVEPNMVNDGREEAVLTVLLDVDGLYQGSDLTIKVKVDADASSQWITYRPGGSTMEEAYNNWSSSH